ncbi:MAG: methyltransferase domain-containing protein [Pseudomonadota bacterium]
MTNKLSRDFWAISNAQALGSELATDPARADLNAEEIKQITALLPSLEGKQVLELGGGIGRFTGLIAAAAKQVTVLDISPEALEQNRQKNLSRSNITYCITDITQHDLPKENYDVVFSNWLLMYFDDADTLSLIKRVKQCLRPNGIAFFRESCRYNYKAIPAWRYPFSAEVLKAFIPGKHRSIYNVWRLKYSSLGQLLTVILGAFKSVHYRESSEYERLFRSAFSQVQSGFIEVYMKKYKNNQQRYWLLTKEGH